jgi:GNAT superfamily N-acetyltransferase
MPMRLDQPCPNRGGVPDIGLAIDIAAHNIPAIGGFVGRLRTNEASMHANDDRLGIIRKLWPTDKDHVRAHLLRLDPDGRHSRFAMGVGEAFLERYAETSFRIDAVLIGYFEAGILRGLAELRPIADHTGAEMEAAFSIEAGWRRNGIGTALFKRLIDIARNRGVKRLYTSCLRTNRAMQRLALKFDGELVLEGGDIMGILPAPPAARTGPVLEAIDDAAGFATAILDMRRRAWLPGRRAV